MAELPPLPQGIRDVFDFPSAEWMDRARRAIGDTDITYLDSAQNLADLVSAATARVNLGVEIGVDVQAYDAGLASIAGLTTAADTMIYTTAVDTYATATLTAAGRALVDDASASDQRTTLGLGTIATQAASSVSITGGTITGITDLAVADGGTGAGTAAAARTNLGVAIGTNVQAWDADLDTYAANPLTAAELGELQNIGTTTISATQWGYVGGADQAVTTADTPSFAAVEVSGTQVVGAQGAAVSDASGGATVDTEARAAINTLLARLRAHGLIAT